MLFRSENEILVLKSRYLMERVVADLGLHITYYKKDFMRMLEVYEGAPFKIKETEKRTLMPCSFTITPKSEYEFEMKYDDQVIKGEFNKEARYPFGVATVVSYPFYLKNHINDDITVNISSTKGMGAALLGGLGVNLINKNASMLLLSMNSSRPGKSADILNNLVAQYNQDAIDDKNVVIENSSIFLQKRLDVIKDELNDIDDKIEGYKKSTQTVNPGSESMSYVQKVSAVEEKMSDLDIQLSLINLLSDFLKKDSNKNELLPYNIGLDNAGLNSQIQSYNDNLIRLNRMMAASSERNPVVADLTISMEAARSSIEKTVEDMKQSQIGRAHV